jgi:hypothetical protein
LLQKKKKETIYRIYVEEDVDNRERERERWGRIYRGEKALIDE